MGKRKKFIDKKSAVTFRLLHRSQRDPLVTDEKAPQHVLHPMKDSKPDKKSELIKYGIYYDDGYDYMQHLKERSNEGELIMVASPIVKKTKQGEGISLPASVFPSEVEEQIGVMNRNAPRSGLNLDLDPDVVAAMDSDFDFSDPENELEDDFMAIANGGVAEKGEDVDEDLGSEDGLFSDEEGYSDEERDEVMSLERSFDKEETKSRFTEYSMTSSVIRRNEQLTMLDDKFEEMFAEYEDNEIGALDTEEIEGDDDNNVLKKFIDDFDLINRKEVITQERPILYEGSDSGDEKEEFDYLVLKPKEKWDCESILSKNSTLYNHPKIIDAPPSQKIKINSKGIAVNQNKLTAGALAKHDSNGVKRSGPASIVSAVSLLSIRSKDESLPEKRSRKKAFREYKKERRIEKKLNTTAFKEEKKKMEKMNANNKSKFVVHL